ncbi:MAG TPA: VIT1/CCC1 transporter family protein [Ktedonobacteraceae bacterium]|jgi:rubrerythrin|nr:VIT1/CCC1 transporter family protein [Ktedonobacteraceae bacterium]
MPGEQQIPANVNKASSVENQTPVSDKLERMSEEDQLVAEAPETLKGQLLELYHAIRTRDDTSRNFLLRVVQPGLAGLMDGSVSTLAPIFATAFATHHAFYAFLVGIAAATGAGISMAFSEALSDNGELTGRGSPVIRGAITGIMTFVGGSLHTLPFLVSDLRIALIIAYFVVALELVLISAIRHRYFGTNWLISVVQVVGSGALVFAAAYIFGNA